MNKDEFLKSGLLEQYVLKLTTPEEDEIVMQFIEQYPEVGREIEELQSALENYAQQQAVSPPADMRDRVLRSVKQSGRPHGRAGRRNLTFLGGLGLVAAFALGLVVFILLQNQQKLRKQFNELESSYAQLETNCMERAERSTVLLAQMELLRNPATQRVQLSGTPLAPEASVIVHWNKDIATGLLQVENLPPPPSGKTYQIWADVEGEMINAGIFDGNSFELQSIDFIANAESLNITLEPAGGSDHPTVELLQANGKV